MSENRKLTEDEIEQIADKVTERMKHELLLNVGKGVLGLTWRGIILLILAVAVYGATKSFHLF